jgi:hypothetical protein
MSPINLRVKKGYTERSSGSYPGYFASQALKDNLKRKKRKIYS